MDEKENMKEITVNIDKDQGLKSKRKMLTVTSLTLLVSSLSGARVEEANTFLKISFTNKEVIPFLLMLATLFLLIRYYNYARPYHDELFDIWSSRMLEEPFFHTMDRSKPLGIIIELADINKLNNMKWNFTVHDSINHGCSWKYKSRLFFRRYIVYIFNHPDKMMAEYDGCKPRFKCELGILQHAGFLKYIQVLKNEIYYRGSGLLFHRENLDILTPYLLGLAAICSYFFGCYFGF
ncbi:hypothetical protein BMR02_14045 [Methylococcaceae bacterium HT1]|nr:hypothetical protein BMR02_14045 [Methylococcaceae bacterium HT1]